MNETCYVFKLSNTYDGTVYKMCEFSWSELMLAQTEMVEKNLDLRPKDDKLTKRIKRRMQVGC